MKGALLAFFFVALAAAGSVGAFLRAKMLSARELGILTPQVGALASGWEAKQVPPSGRAVLFLLGDVRAAFNPLDASPDTDGGFAEAAGDWIGRSLIGGSASAPATETPLVRAFMESAQIAQWTHVRYSAASEAATSREVEKAILKAHDAGAEIDFIAQGADAAPVLLALKRLDGVERGGQKVGASKVLLLGVNEKTLKRMRSLAGLEPGKLGNVFEMAAVWSARDQAKSVRMDFLNGKRAGTPIQLEAVWPDVAVEGHTIENTLKRMKEALESPLTLDETLSRQEAAMAVINAKKAEEAAAKAQVAAATAAQQQVQVQTQQQAQAQAAAQAQAGGAPGDSRMPSYSRPDPSAALPQAAAKKETIAPPKRHGPIAGPSDWPSAPVKEFLSEFNGNEIGWLVSAPKKVLDSISTEVDISMPANTPECKAAIGLRAYSLNKVPTGGDRDAAILALYDTRTNISSQPRLGSPAKKQQFGYQVRVYKTAQKPLERTYTAIEADQHMIYLFLEVNYGKEENHDACLQTHLPTYQRIADNIRPN